MRFKNHRDDDCCNLLVFQTKWLAQGSANQIGSIAEKIQENIDGYRDIFSSIAELAALLGPVWLERWRDFY
jgi:hypothetical protein